MANGHDRLTRNPDANFEDNTRVRTRVWKPSWTGEPLAENVISVPEGLMKGVWYWAWDFSSIFVQDRQHLDCHPPAAEFKPCIFEENVQISCGCQGVFRQRWGRARRYQLCSSCKWSWVNKHPPWALKKMKPACQNLMIFNLRMYHLGKMLKQPPNRSLKALRCSQLLPWKSL